MGPECKRDIFCLKQAQNSQQWGHHWAPKGGWHFKNGPKLLWPGSKPLVGGDFAPQNCLACDCCTFVFFSPQTAAFTRKMGPSQYIVILVICLSNLLIFIGWLPIQDSRLLLLPISANCISIPMLICRDQEMSGSGAHMGPTLVFLHYIVTAWESLWQPYAQMKALVD